LIVEPSPEATSIFQFFNSSTFLNRELLTFNLLIFNLLTLKTMGLVKTGIVQRRLMCGGLAEAVRRADNRWPDIFIP
jgi:hypothetical protein